MSPTPSHQTARLSKGRHRSAADGACVVELASMLKGRRFSDRVYCIDPAIMAFLWGYNDHVGDELRQDLYRVAGVVLDTNRGNELAARRAEMCRVWALQARSLRSRPLVLLRGVHAHVLWSLRFRRHDRVDLADCELAGAYVATMARRDPAWHAWTLRFIGILVALGDDDSAVSPPATAPPQPRLEESPTAAPAVSVAAGRNGAS